MTDLNQYQTHIEDLTNPSPLFKALDKNSNQEVYFHNQHEAYEWMFSHKHWILKKREVINWTFPLEKIISKECWIKIG